MAASYVNVSRYQIGYEHIAELGGLRGLKDDIPPRVNGFWRNQSFHNYADYAMSQSFRDGLARLRELGHAAPSAVMCAEALWWQCHRRIISDYLIAVGESVFHIMAAGRIEPAQMTEGADLGPEGDLTYPAPL